MGTVRVEKVIRFSYVLDDPGFSGSEMANAELYDQIGTAIDAYLARDDRDKFEVINQSVIVERESHYRDV